MTPHNGPPDLLTKYDVAKMLGVSTRTVVRLMRNGTIPFLRLGHRTLRFRLDDINKGLTAMMENNNNGD